MPSKYKIKIDKEKCIGCASCVAIAPKTFEMDKENKATIKKDDHDDDKTILQAAQSCSVNAINLINKKGKKVYPK